MQDDKQNILGLSELITEPEPVQNDYLHYFQTVTEYKDERENNYYEPWVSLTVENSGVAFNKTSKEEEEEWLKTPLTFEIISGGTLYWKRNSTPAGASWTERVIEYRKNEGTWTPVTSTTSTGAITTVSAGDIVEFRGYNDCYGVRGTAATTTEMNTYVSCRFSGTTNVKYRVYGNIMSLINGDDFADLKDLPGENTFTAMFSGCTGLIMDGQKPFLLPATGLTNNCYRSMFIRCTGVTVPPDLPATHLKQCCYAWMFNITSFSKMPKIGGSEGLKELAPYCFKGTFCSNSGIETVPKDLFSGITDAPAQCFCNMFDTCPKLIVVPDLPATNLDTACYYAMFNACSSLTMTPVLQAESVPASGYAAMFQNCKSLRLPPDLPATSVSTAAYRQMFKGCENLVFAPALPATNISSSGYCEMFAQCTSITEVASMSPSSVSAAGCFNMYSGCTSLSKASVLPSMNIGNNCYDQMFRGCTSLVTVPKDMLPATKLDNYCYSSMFHDCTNLRVMPDLPAVIIYPHSYYYMVANCGSLTNDGVCSVPDEISPRTGSCRYMFMNCTSLTVTPEIKVRSLNLSACTGMYEGCTNLRSAHVYGITLAPHAYSHLFYGCSNLTAITVEFENEPGDLYTLDWVDGVAASGVFTKPSAACWHLVGTNGIPEGWTYNHQYGIEIEEEILNSTSASTTLNMYVHSNGNWTLASGPAWVTLSETAGTSGITLITVTTSLNDTGDYREGSIVLNSQDNVEASVLICQSDDTDWADKPLTFEILSSGTLYWKNTGDNTGALANAKSIQYSKNGGASVTITSTLAGAPISCEAGDIIEVYHGTASTQFRYNSFSGDTNLKCCMYGNIKSLIYGTNYRTGTASWYSSYKFFSMFKGFTSLYTDKHKQFIGIVPSGTSNSPSYYAENMFSGCTNIVNGYNFIFKGEHISTSAMHNLFVGCGIKTLPQISVTSGGSGAFSTAFGACRSLKCINGYDCSTIPTTSYLYSYLFSSDINLKYARITFSNDKLYAYQYQYMFNSCVNLVIPPERLPVIASGNANAYNNMFVYCYSMKESPILPAITATAQIYAAMFRYCGSLQKVECWASPGTKHNYWMSDIPDGGTFIRNSTATSGWSRDTHGIPSDWTIVDKVIS